MTSVEKRRSGRKSGGHRKHSDGGYSDTSSGGSFLDETDREVSNLTDRAFRSLCIGDEAVYNDSDLCSSSPCSQRDRQLAFGHSGQDRDREEREREELKRAAHESFSLRVQQYGQDWIHGGMYGAEIQRDPQWEVYGERTQGRVSATFQHSFVETSQQEDSLRQEQLSFHSNGATELSLQQRRSRSRVSSLIRAFNSEGHRDGAVMDGNLREWNDETSWDKSALMSIQKELSEFSTSYQQNFNSGHFPTAGPFSSRDANFYSSEVAAMAHMNSASSFMRSCHSKHSMSAQVNCNSNFFIHSEFSPFKVWRDHNRFPFQQGEVSGFMHSSEFPKWYETPMYKELSLEAQPQGPYRFEERGIRHPRKNMAPVVPPTPSRSTSTSTMLQKALPVEQRCESELAGHYPHRRRAQSLGTNRLPSQRPSTASPTIEMSRRVQDTISSVKALQQKIKMMTEQNITTSMTVNQQEILYSNDNLIPNYANTVASNVVSNNTSTTPFNISQLLTPSVHAHQEIETSEIHQYAVSPQPVEHPPVRAESRGATPDVRMSSYKSRATSLLFNLKDNRKRVKSTYSPPKFKGLETQERNKQPPIQEPRDTVIDIPDFPDQDIQYHQAEEASRTNAASHQYVNPYHNSGLILNSQPATAHTGQYSEYNSGDYQAAQMQGGMVHHSGFTGFLPENYAGNQLANGQNLYEDLSSFTPYKQGMIDNVETLGGDVYRYKPSYSATGAPGLNADNQTRQYLISKANTEQHFNETVGREFSEVDRYQQLSDNKHDYSNVSTQDRWRQTNSQDTENLSLKTAVSPWKQEITALIEKDQHAQAYQRAAVIKEELTLPRDKYRGENQQIINKEPEKIELRESFGVGTSSHKQTGWVNPNISDQLPQYAQFSNDAVENPACYGQQQPGAFKDKYAFQKYYGHYKENKMKDNYLTQNNNIYSDQEYRNQHTFYSNDMLTQETGQGKPMPKGQEMQSLQLIEAKSQFEPNMQKKLLSNPDNASAPTLEKRVEQRQLVEVKAEQAVADHVKAQHAQAELAKAQHWAQVEQPKVESARLILAGQTGSEKVKAEQAKAELKEFESVNQAKDEHIEDKRKEEQTRAEQTRIQKVTEEPENITEEAGAKQMREVQGEQVTAEQAEAKRLKEEHIKTELVKTVQTGQGETEQARREKVTAEQLEEERLRAEQAERERVEAEQIRTEKIKAEQAESERRKAEQAKQEQIKEQQAKTEQARLEKMKEQQAKAEHARLEQMKEQQAKAEQARLEQMKEQQAKMEQARLEQQAKVEQARLEQMKEQQAKAEQARLEQMKEQQAKAEQARLEQQVKAEQARLEQMKEQQAKAEQAILEQTREQQAKLEQIKEQQAKAEQARLEQMKEQQAKAEQATQEQMKEQHVKAEQARLEQQAKAEQTRLEQMKEQQAKAEQARLQQMKEQQAKLEQIKEQQAKAEQAKLEQIKEQQAKAEQAKLEQLKEQQAKAKEAQLAKLEQTKVKLPEAELTKIENMQEKLTKPTAKITQQVKSEPDKVEQVKTELAKAKAELAKIKEKMRGEQKEKVRNTILAKEDGVKKDEPLKVNITKNEEHKDQEQAMQTHQQREDSVVVKSQSIDPANRGITEYERLREKYGFTDTDSTDRNKSSTAENISSNNPNETSALPLDKVKTTYNEISKDKYSPPSIFATSNTEIKDEMPDEVTESPYVYSESSKEFKLSGADYLPTNVDRANIGTAADKVKDGTLDKLEKYNPVKHTDVSQQRDSDFVKPLPLERKPKSNEHSVGPGKDQHFTPPRALSHKERAQTKQEILTSKIKAHAEKEISAIKEKGFAIRDGFMSKTSAKQLAGSQNINIRQRPPSHEVPKKHESTMSSNTTPKHQMEPSGKQMEPVKSVSPPVKSAATTSQLVDHLQKQVPKEPMKSNDNVPKPPKEAKQTGSYTMSTDESLAESAKKENQSGVKPPMPSKEQAPKNKQAKQESNHGEISAKQKEGLKDNPAVNTDHLNKKIDNQATARVGGESSKSVKTEKAESQQEAVDEDSTPSLKLVFGQNETPVADDSLQITGIMVTVRERNPSVNSTQNQINAKEQECSNSDKCHPSSDLEVNNRNTFSKEAGKVEVKDKGAPQNTHPTVKEDLNKIGINNHPENVQETSTLETRQNNMSENVNVKMMSSSANARPQRETQVQESLTEKGVTLTATVPAKNKAETQPPVCKQEMIARETKDYTNKMLKENSAKRAGNEDVKSHTKGKNPENMQTAHTNENFMAKMVNTGINYMNDSNRVHAETVIKHDTHPSMKDDMTTVINPSESRSADGRNAPLLERKRHDPTPPKPINKTSSSNHFTENENINISAKHQYQDSHIRENNQEDDTDVHIGSIAIRVVPALTEKDNLKMVGKHHVTTVPSDVTAAIEHKQVASSSHEEKVNTSNTEDRARDFPPSNEKQMAESLEDKSGAQLSDSLKIRIQQNTINITSENAQDENRKPEKVNKYGKSVGGSKTQPVEGDYFQVVAGTNNEPHSGANVGGDTSDAHPKGGELPGLLPNKSATSNESYNEEKNEVFVLDQSKMKTMESSSVNVQEENMKRKSRETESNLVSKQSDGSSESNKSNKNEKTEAGQAIHIRKQHTENQSSFSARERQGSRNSHPTRENTVKEKPEVKPKPKERTSTIPEISAIADYARLKVIVSEDRETPIQEFPPNKKEGFFPLIQTRHSRRPVFTADPQDLSVKEKSLPNKTEVSSKVNKEPKPLVFPITEKEHLRTGMFKLGDKERQEKIPLEAKANDDILDNEEEHAQHLRERNKSPTTHLKSRGSEKQVTGTDTQRVCQIDQSIHQPKNSNLHATLGQVHNTEKSKHTPLRKDEKIENALAKTGEERPEILRERLETHHEETTAKQGRAKQLEEEQVEKRAEDMKIKYMIEESRASLAEEERRAAQREEERRTREREAIAIKIKERREKQREAERRAEEERKAKQIEEERAAQKEEEMRAKQREEDRRMKESEEKRKIKIEEERRAKLREEEERIRESERRAAQEEQQRRAAQEEQQRRAAQEEEQRRKAAQEEQQRRAAQEQQQRRAAQEEEQRRAAEEEQQRRAAQEEEQRRRAAQEEEQRRRAAQEEEQRRRAAKEEQQRRAAQEEEQRKKAAQEEQQRRAAQEQQQRRAAQEEERRRKAAQEEERRRKAAQEEQQKRAAQEEQQRRAAQEEEQQRRGAQEEQQRRAAQEAQQRRAALFKEQQRRAALIEEQRRAKQIEEKILNDSEDEKKRKQREEEQRKAEHQTEEQRSERQKREELMRAQREQEEIQAVQKVKTIMKQREEKQAKEDRTILAEAKQAALKEEEKRVAQEQVLSQREDEIMAKKREEEKLAAYREKERVAQMEEQKRAAQKMDALQYYAFTSTESERKSNERQLCSPLPSQRHNPTGLDSTEDSHTRPYRPPASPAPSLPRSSTSSPAFGGKPLMFRVKDNTNRGSSLTKSVRPRFHKNFGEDFRVGSPMGSDRGEEEHETMRRSIDSGLNRLASIKESSTFQPGTSSQDYSASLPHYRPYSRRSIALDEDDSRSVISNMSEDVESFATSAADLADVRGLYDYERPESACSFSSDVSRLGKPPAVPPKSEKAMRRAKRLATRRIKKELSKAVAATPAGTEKPLQEVSGTPSSSSTEVRSSNHYAVASPHFSPPVSLAHAPTLGSSLPSSHTEHQSSHSSFYASPHATGPVSLPAASPHATAPVSIPVASPHAAGPASHPAAPKTVADVPSSPTLHHAKHPAPVTQYHVESSYPQSYPMTQRKVLQDLGSGQYFVVDVPVQVKTKTFFDPETGKYVQLNVRESSQSASRPQPQQAYLQPQLKPQIHGKLQQQPLSQDSPAGKPHALYQGYHGYPQGYQPAAIKRSSAPVTLHQDQQPVNESHSYGYPAPEMGQNSEGRRYSPEKTPYMDTVNDTDKTYNTAYNTHSPYESFPQCDTNSQLAGSSVCENDNSAHSQYQPRDIITMSELEDFMELSDW